MEVLYGTNVFVMDKAIDTPFLISRLFAPSCASLITSLDISFIFGVYEPGPEEDDWMSTYAAFFELFERSFHGVHRLRLLLRMPPGEFAEDFIDPERIRAFFKPLGELSKGREWTRLQLCAPHDWHNYFGEIKETMPGQAGWELTYTIWSDPSLRPLTLL